MTGTSKPGPWNWSHGRTLAAKLGLPAPRLFWPLWEGAGGVANEVCLGITGTLQPAGAALPWQDGGLRLNGSSQYVSVPFSPVMNLTALTLLAWVRTVSTSGNQEIISRDNASGGGVRIFQFRLLSGRPDFIPFFSGSPVTTYTGGTNIADGKPHLIGVTLGSDFVRLYVDGRIDFEASESRDLDTGTRELALGRDAMASNQYFNGRLRGAMMIPGTLTPAQMRTLAAQPFAYHVRTRSAAVYPLVSGRPAAYFRLLQQHTVGV
jgi:hypothetical protein